MVIIKLFKQVLYVYMLGRLVACAKFAAHLGTGAREVFKFHCVVMLFYNFSQNFHFIGTEYHFSTNLLYYES